MDIEIIFNTLKKQIESLKELKKEQYSNPEDIYNEIQRLAKAAEQSLEELNWSKQSRKRWKHRTMKKKI